MTAASTATLPACSALLRSKLMDGGGNVALRDLRSRVEALLKQLQRRETRLAACQGDAVQLRQTNSDLQRELRCAQSHVLQLRREKEAALKEGATLRETLARQSVALRQLAEPGRLLDALQLRDAALQRRQDEISALHGEVLLREEQIARLEHELRAAQRSLALQNVVETPASETLGIHADALRKLYCDLGRQQADNHAMSLALAEATNQLQLLRLQLRDQQTEQQLLQQQCSELREEGDRREAALRKAMDELTASAQQRESLELQGATLHEQLGQLQDDLQRRQQAIDEQHEQQRRDQLRLQELVATLESDKKTLMRRTLALERLLDEQRRSQERMDREKDVLLAEVLALRKKDADVAELQAQLSTAEISRKLMEESLAGAHTQLQALQEAQESAKGRDVFCTHQLNAEIQRRKELEMQAAAAARQADQLAVALQESLEKVRQLAQRAKEEQSRAQQLTTQLKQETAIREQLSTALLELLHQERVHSIAAPGRSEIGMASPLLSHNTAQVIDALVNDARRGDLDWLRDDAAVLRAVETDFTSSPSSQSARTN